MLICASLIVKTTISNPFICFMFCQLFSVNCWIIRDTWYNFSVLPSLLQVGRSQDSSGWPAAGHELNAGLAGPGRGRAGHPSGARSAAAHQTYSGQSAGRIPPAHFQNMSVQWAYPSVMFVCASVEMYVIELSCYHRGNEMCSCVCISLFNLIKRILWIQMRCYNVSFWNSTLKAHYLLVCTSELI